MKLIFNRPIAGKGLKNEGNPGNGQLYLQFLPMSSMCRNKDVPTINTVAADNLPTQGVAMIQTYPFRLPLTSIT